MTPDTATSEPDNGARALAAVLQILGLPADPTEIAHNSGKQKLDETDLLRAARRFPVKARAHRSSFERLAKTPLPALAELKWGGWLVLGRVAEDKVLVLDPRTGRPELLDRADFAERWNGRLILLTRRAPLGNPARPGISASAGLSARSKSIAPHSARCWSPRSFCSSSG